jgi:hypothetical protein
MGCFTCGSNSFRSISVAMAKAASARWRQLSGGRTAVDWVAREEVCARCPMQVISGGTSYCGTPFLRKIDRDPVLDGCGCPTRSKAKSPDEHCPVNANYEAAAEGQCDCKWCALAADRQKMRTSNVQR